MKRFLPLLTLTLSLIATTTSAATSPQEDCYNALKENMVSIPAFSEAAKIINTLSYSNIEGTFSRPYKNMSSFGIDLDQPLFQLRFSFFGKETGYRHPPASPFPISTQSEVWDTNGKEYMVVEEYLTSPEGQNIFISCGLMRISADDLMKVTRDRYAYDGSMSSILRTTPSYKAWYNQNDSYDFEWIPFVTWDRLFIYPKTTKNDYFDKYSVIDAAPHNTTDDFANVWKVSTWVENTGDDTITVKTVDEKGRTLSVEGAPKELNAPATNAHTAQFFFYDVFQSIENLYPDFAKHVALRGVLSFDTFKRVLSEKDPSRLADFWRNFGDSARVSKYFIDKQAGKINPEDYNKEFETFIAGLSVYDKTLTSFLDSNSGVVNTQAILEQNIATHVQDLKTAEAKKTAEIVAELKNKTNNINASNNNTESNASSDQSSSSSPLVIIIALLAIILVAALVMKRK